MIPLVHHIMITAGLTDGDITSLQSWQVYNGLGAPLSWYHHCTLYQHRHQHRRRHHRRVVVVIAVILNQCYHYHHYHHPDHESITEVCQFGAINYNNLQFWNMPTFPSEYAIQVKYKKSCVSQARQLPKQINMIPAEKSFLLFPAIAEQTNMQ